jgi:hypothetical protein
LLLVDSLFEQGNIYKQNKRYVDVILSYEDALNTRISDYKLNNELGFTILEFLKKDLTLCYNDRTKEIWYNHDISKMEEAVNYMNKGKNLDEENNNNVFYSDYLLNVPSNWHYFNMYYYLYKAKDESVDSNRSNYLYQSQKYLLKQEDSFRYFIGLMEL